MNKKVAKRQVISLMLSLALIISGIMFPVTNAKAAEETMITYYDWDETTKQLVQKTIAEESCTVVTGETTELTGVEGGSWYIIKDDIETEARIYVKGDVHLILADNSKLLAGSGIDVSEEDGSVNSLSIYSQSLSEETMGSIEAKGYTANGFYTMGAIGGDDGKNAGTIIINGGLITANGIYGAGIGGGNNGNGGNIIINGGILDVDGTDGAAIGAGRNGAGGNITINGGTVDVYASEGAGIGGGANESDIEGQLPTANNDGGNIIINGGTIKASGNASAGIGGGRNGSGGKITINGGIIDSKGVNGAGIGGGYNMDIAGDGSYGNGGTITINGGKVTSNGNYGAGIGGGRTGNGGNITINGGEITARCQEAAGIGGGYYGNGESININGGEITARSDYGAGIGGGNNGDGGIIKIKKGTVSTYAYSGAGIGGGHSGNGGNITIDGGTVYSNTDSNPFYGAGIGGGWYGSAGTITINGGTITAKASYAAGIGTGRSAEGGTIKIEGGNITVESDLGAGIGCSGYSSIETVTINGGIINTKSHRGAGIGTGEICEKSDSTKVSINGGTITAESEEGAGIGGGYDTFCCDLDITGGNIKATSQYADKIGNGHHKTADDIRDSGVGDYINEDVCPDLYYYIRTIILCGMTEQTPIDSAVGIGNYGLTEVLTLDDNKLYFYLPKSTDMSSVTADGTVYIGRFEDGESEATFHNCTYTKDGNKIIAACTTENCVSFEVSIAKPADTTYTGKAIEAQVTVNPENSFVPEVTYVANTGSLTDGKPVNAGNYTASITLGEETISVTYDITKTGSPAEMPKSSMKVTCDKKTVKDIELPTDWSWSSKDASKTLTVGKNTTATAVYTGSDKGYYETEEVKVTITSEHTGKTEVKDAKEATYDAEGYTGDTYCRDCATMLTKGEKVAKLVKSDVDVKYTTHVQSYGWQDEVKNGAMSGTSGEAKRLEGIVVSVDSEDDLGIQYTTHCQTYGWLPWVSNGDMSGTTGEAKRLEAIMIKLTGADAQYYDVYYRVHAQSYGWLNWAKNGEPSGTAGYGKRLEGIQIVVVKKGEAIDEKLGGIVSTNDKAYIATEGKSPIYDGTTTDNTNPVVGGNDLPTVKYRTHVQSYGWLNYEYNGGMSGTSGEAKRLEGIDIDVSNTNMSGDIVYTTHAQSYGWQSDLNDKTKWFKNGQIAGTLGEAKRLEAICIDLTGELKENYDIYYRVHIQSYGWLDWACNGAPSGSEGLAKRLEGIQIVIVPKGSSKPAATYMGITTASDKSYIK